jgi:hypothetical protein
MIKVISKYKYKQIVTDLLDWDIVECDNIAIYGCKSKGYKLKAPFDISIKKIPIKDKKMNEKINQFKSATTLTAELKKTSEKFIRSVTTTATEKNLSIAYQYLKQNIVKINIDKKKALQYNEENYFSETAKKTYKANYHSIINLSEGEYKFKVDSTAYRVHTNLTNIKKELRQFLSVEGEPLGEVDIKNSQPLFFYWQIKNLEQIPDDEKIRYKEMVESGKFYELFIKRLGIPDSKRAKVKKKIISAIFFDYNREKESRYVTVFKKEFPSIASYIYQYKKENRSKLACLLQRLESNFVIEKAVREFINRFGDEFVSTIHDSMVVKESKLNDALQVMEYCFEKEGLNPKLSFNIYYNNNTTQTTPNNPLISTNNND